MRDRAEETAARVLATMGEGGCPTALSDADPWVLRETLRLLAEYDAEIVVRIAAEAIEAQAAFGTARSAPGLVPGGPPRPMTLRRGRRA